jgi:hypothetical protein
LPQARRTARTSAANGCESRLDPLNAAEREQFAALFDEIVTRHRAAR